MSKSGKLLYGSMDRIGVVKIRVWLTVAHAAAKLDVSEDTIYRREIPWQDDHVPGKIRSKDLFLDKAKKEGKRFLEDDLEAMLSIPRALEQPNRRKLFVRN